MASSRSGLIKARVSPLSSCPLSSVAGEETDDVLTSEVEEPVEAGGDKQESFDNARSPRLLVPERSLDAEKQTFSSGPLFTVKWRSRNGHFKIPSFLPKIGPVHKHFRMNVT
jgi:hypothetical protein